LELQNIWWLVNSPYAYTTSIDTYYYSTLLAFQDEVNAINANSNKNDSAIDMLISAVYSKYIPFRELQQAKRRFVFLLVGPA